MYRKQDIYQFIASKIRQLADWVEGFRLISMIVNISYFNDSKVKTTNSDGYEVYIKSNYKPSTFKAERAKMQYTQKEASRKLIPGIVVELQNPLGEWFDYTMKDTWNDYAHLNMCHIQGKLKFKIDE